MKKREKIWALYIELDLKVLEPYTLNKYIDLERRNKFLAHKAKKTATNYSRLKVIEAMGQGVQFNWPCELQFTWYLPNKRVDGDNWAFTKKFILDGMQGASYMGQAFLENDNLAHITGFRDTFFIDKERPRVLITEIPTMAILTGINNFGITAKEGSKRLNTQLGMMNKLNNKI